MCGISGIVTDRPISPEEVRALGPMLESLAHRGPDDSGRYLGGRAAIGHRRLSIIDLATGRQPIPNEAGNVWAAVNGEIYNFLDLRDNLTARGHVFRTAGDSECLVHLYEEYGDDCAAFMDGMWAFALWDERAGKLLLGRDRLGVKPLYYHQGGGRIVFGSELKAVLAAPGVPTDIDPTALVDYLTFSFIPSPKTIFRDVCKLPAGHVLTFREGRTSVRRYWDLHHRGWTTDPPEVVADQLWWRLRQATRPRLVADVPVGAFLSGGLDSTAVVAAMTQLARNEIVTITCGFEEQGFDERPAALEAAALLRTRHHELLVRPDAAGIAETLGRYFDEPFADASAIPTYYLAQQARQFVKVALSGDGGDEALAGYRRYRFDRYEEAVRRGIPRILRRPLFGMLAAAYPQRPWMPRWLRARATLRNLAEDGATAHGLSVATLDPADALRLLQPDVARECRGYDPLHHVRRAYRRCDAPDHLAKCQYVDICLGLGDGMLVKVDRASMAHGLEVRSPMLDHRFLEFVWKIPPEERIRGQAGKHPLRSAVERHLGRDIAQRQKRGFEVPLDEWFAGPLRERFQDGLLRAGGPVLEWISPEAIERLWRQHMSGRQLNGPTLWKLVVLDAWCRRYRTPAGRQHDFTPPSAKAEGSAAVMQISRSEIPKPAARPTCIR